MNSSGQMAQISSVSEKQTINKNIQQQTIIQQQQSIQVGINENQNFSTIPKCSL